MTTKDESAPRGGHKCAERASSVATIARVARGAVSLELTSGNAPNDALRARSSGLRRF